MTAIPLLSTARPEGELRTEAVPKQDLAAVRRLLAAFNCGDSAALDEVDSDAELQDEPRIPGADGTTGTAEPCGGR